MNVQNVPSCSEEDLAFLFPDCRMLKLPHGGISMDGILFHCIQPDNKQSLIYFKLAPWSEITSNCHHAVKKNGLLFPKKPQ